MSVAPQLERLEEVRERVHAEERVSLVTRRASLDDVEFRDDGGKLIFQGHAAVFGRLSEDLGGFRERIQRGAFRKVLDGTPDVRLLFNHDGNFAMARTTVRSGPGMLDLSEDPRGLRVYAELVPTTQAADLRKLVNAGVVSQMSFGFSMSPGGTDVWAEEDSGLVRSIVSFGSLFDVGPVVFPAYPQTDASMRSRVCGVDILSSTGDVLEPALRDLAWKIHRGERVASVEERAAVDAAFARTDTVSPWMAQRALMALPREPELQGVIQGKRATVVLNDEPSGDPVAYRLAARRRRLHASRQSLAPQERRGTEENLIGLLGRMVGLAGDYLDQETDPSLGRSMQSVLDEIESVMQSKLAAPNTPGGP